MTEIRSDLFFAIDKLSQFYCDFTIRYINIVNRVLRYIRDTIHLNLRFQDTEDSYKFVDIVYADHKTDRKTIYRFVFLCDNVAYI